MGRLLKDSTSTAELVYVTGSELIVPFLNWVANKRIKLIPHPDIDQTELALFLDRMVTLDGYRHPKEELGASIGRNQAS